MKKKKSLVIHIDKEGMWIEEVKGLVKQDLKKRKNKIKIGISLAPSIIEGLKKESKRLAVKFSPLVESILRIYLLSPEMLEQKRRLKKV